jgi:sialic acid synthase
MKIYIDIDNTICFTNSNDYSQSKPNYENIKKVNELYENNTIIMWTARGTMTGINWFEITYNQLKEWKVKFHELRMGKPAFDILIDDRVLNSIYHWNDKNINNILNNEKSIKEIKINDSITIGGDNPCLIIAEIGQNHQGDINIAKQMIKMVKECGADVAKFQKSTLIAKFNKAALARPYNSKNSFGKTYGEHKHFLEFSEEDFIELKRYAEEDVGILFTASGMDIPAFDFLDKINCPFFKIGSGDTNNLELIEHVCKKNKPTILSTGMNNFDSVKKSIDLARKYNDKMCLLQCTSSYPLPDDQVNLNVIKTYLEEFGHNTVIGYSGHETGLSLTLAAIALGAKVIERHVTLDKTLKGTDHSASLEPKELKQLCEEIRRIEKALGSGKKKIELCEKACHDKLGKSIVVTRDITAGETLVENDLTIKVADPKGINPNKFFDCIGKKVYKNIKEDDSLLDQFLTN